MYYQWLPYSVLFSRRLYFANFAKAQPILEKKLMWEEAWFSISIREITFREQELNWLFAKYKRLENNPLYGIPLHVTLQKAEFVWYSLVFLYLDVLILVL